MVRRSAHSLPRVRRHPTTNPILPVRDMPEATAFYSSLGFTVRAYDDGYAWVTHCGWEWFHLRLVPDLDPAVNAASAYLHVDDVGAWRAAMTSSAGELPAIGPVDDMPWGMREFALTDPSGNLVRVGQHL